VLLEALLERLLTPFDVDQVLRALTVRDFRVQCRLRNLSPAGSQETLKERLKEHMLATGDFLLRAENGEALAATPAMAGMSSDDAAVGYARNNYVRSEGQNVGNFLTDRASSRVLAPPGGQSSIVFGDDSAPLAPRDNVMYSPSRGPTRLDSFGQQGSNNKNNYSRPGGQNVGNFLTDRSSSRISNPPGGHCQITFG